MIWAVPKALVLCPRRGAQDPPADEDKLSMSGETHPLSSRCVGRAGPQSPASPRFPLSSEESKNQTRVLPHRANLGENWASLEHACLLEASRMLSFCVPVSWILRLKYSMNICHSQSGFQVQEFPRCARLFFGVCQGAGLHFLFWSSESSMAIARLSVTRAATEAGAQGSLHGADPHSDIPIQPVAHPIHPTQLGSVPTHASASSPIIVSS